MRFSLVSRSVRGHAAPSLTLLGAALVALGCAEGTQPTGESTGAGPGSGGSSSGPTTTSAGGGGSGGSTGSAFTTSSSSSGSGGAQGVGGGGGSTSDGGGATGGAGVGGAGVGGDPSGAGGAGGAAPECGNGVIDGTDACDMTDLGTATCMTEGFQMGTLACTAQCALDTSGCSTCGNGTREAGEECDTNDFDAATCMSEGFQAGMLACTNQCLIDTAACSTCGDGSITGTEVCDGTNVGTQTCVTQGFPLGGTLVCGASCLGYDTSGCATSGCSNGIDDDQDGFTDATDPGCTSTADDDEALYAPNCNGLGSPIYDVTLADTETNYRYNNFTSLGSPSDFAGSCRNSDGRERIFVYESPIAQPWIVFTTDEPNTDFDTVLYVRSGTCTGSQLACNDDDIDAFYSFTNSTVQVNNVAAGQLLFIFVDAWTSNGGGTFDLGVYPESAND